MYHSAFSPLELRQVKATGCLLALEHNKVPLNEAEGQISTCSAVFTFFRHKVVIFQSEAASQLCTSCHPWVQSGGPEPMPTSLVVPWWEEDWVCSKCDRGFLYDDLSSFIVFSFLLRLLRNFHRWLQTHLADSLHLLGR